MFYPSQALPTNNLSITKFPYFVYRTLPQNFNSVNFSFLVVATTILIILQNKTQFLLSTERAFHDTRTASRHSYDIIYGIT